MSITASRLGSAPITIDWSNLAPAAASGRPGALDPQALEGAWAALKSRFASGEVGFFDAPVRPELSQAEASRELAGQLLSRRVFTDCLFLGIGGSALGPLSLLAALEDRRENDIRFHFMENPDPLAWRSTLKGLSPERTLVCVAAKSGTTFETMAQLLLSLEWLGPSRLGSHLVAITDPAQGDLRAFCRQNSVPALEIAPSIGGRFSVFTPVGLFAAGMAGLSVADFLLGARQARDYVEKSPREKNPLFILGHELIRHAQKRPIHVCMPYATRLKQLGSWFVQLWGESLGKDGKGFTPLGALGATDQHSLLQLLRDGPDDKITLFVTVDELGEEVKIPRLPAWKGPDGKVLSSAAFPAFRILEGHTLQHLLRSEYQATSRVLTRRGRPNLTFQLDRLDERSMGALYFALATLTAVTGTLWGVNPFDQPGVEEGKVYIRESLTRDHSAPEEDDENSPVNRLRRYRALQTESE